MRFTRAREIYPCVSEMASVQDLELASFVAQVKGVMFYDLSTSGAVLGDAIHLIREPSNPNDVNSIAVMFTRGNRTSWKLLWHHSFLHCCVIYL